MSEIYKDSVRINSKITISDYAKAGNNINYIGTSFPRIGTSLTTVNKLMGKTGVLELLMPQLINSTPSTPGWNRDLVTFLHSVSVPVPEGGLLLDVSLSFDALSPTLNENRKQLAKEQGVKLDTLASVKEYLTKTGRSTGIIDPFTVILYATPVVPSDYFLYLHCLLYKDVANTLADVDKAPHIRFYMVREEEESQQRAIVGELIKEATMKLSKILSDPKLIENTYYLLKQNEILTGKFSTSQAHFGNQISELTTSAASMPAEVISILGDSMSANKSNVLRYIAYGVLTDVPLTSTVITQNGTALGSTLDECVAFLEKEENSKIKKECEVLFKELKDK